MVFWMQIVARRTLRQFWLLHPRAELPLRNWYTLVSKADWSRPSDVKRMFGSNVDFVAGNRLIFDIAGNRYRLIAFVAYPYRRILIKFIGTHAEYDKINPEKV